MEKQDMGTGTITGAALWSRLFGSSFFEYKGARESLRFALKVLYIIAQLALALAGLYCLLELFDEFAYVLDMRYMALAFPNPIYAVLRRAPEYRDGETIEV